MKLCLVCSTGGHLTQMMQLRDAFEGHEIFLVTYESARTRCLNHKKYLLKKIGTNPYRMFKSFLKFAVIYLKEKPDLVLSTGSEIGIPGIFVAKLMRIKTIYIESFTRVRTKSFTGKVVYFVSDLFLVQWPQLLSKYGGRARYEGAVI